MAGESPKSQKIPPGTEAFLALLGAGTWQKRKVTTSLHIKFPGMGTGNPVLKCCLIIRVEILRQTNKPTE